MSFNLNSTVLVSIQAGTQRHCAAHQRVKYPSNNVHFILQGTNEHKTVDCILLGQGIKAQVFKKNMHSLT